MKAIKLMPLLAISMLVVLMTSCGPSYVGVGAGPYYGPRPYYGYNYGYRPYGYYRPPVIVQRPTYIIPRGGYYNRPYPNARRNYGGGSYNGYGGGRSRGPR